jgi:RNA polymerase sigma-70 factor (ECF subfamily)
MTTNVMVEPRTTPSTQPPAAAPVFCTTRWTQVLAARGPSEPARQALSELCAAYYEPVVAFLARTGRDADASRELAHEFFARVLEGDPLANVRREGRFRSYLLGALKHFLSHQRARERRLKRGGGAQPLSLDAGTDTTPGLDPADASLVSPDAAFDREWATTVLARALAELRRESDAEGKGAQFERLKPWLTGQAEQGDQAELARSLGWEISALKSTVHRLRRRFRHLVKQEVAATLAGPAGVEEEMRALFAALRS